VAKRKHRGALLRRKNLNVDQALLDRAREVLGVRTETEAVERGLAAAIEQADFKAAMLAGFDRLMEIDGLNFVEGEEIDLSGFRTSSADTTE